MSTRARDRQVGGDHYHNMGVQPWDAMESWMGLQEFSGFLRGSAIKYLARAGAKGDMEEDIRKAHHYTEKLLEVLDEVEKDQGPQMWHRPEDS